MNMTTRPAIAGLVAWRDFGGSAEVSTMYDAAPPATRAKATAEIMSIPFCPLKGVSLLTQLSVGSI